MEKVNDFKHKAEADVTSDIHHPHTDERYSSRIPDE